MRKKINVLALVLAGSLLFGCGSKDKDHINKTEEPKPTEEVTVTEEPTQEAEAENGEKPEGDKEKEEDKVIEIPNEEELTADYTSVEGLILEKGSHIAVVVKNTEQGYWKAVKQGINQAIEDLNQELGYEGDDQIRCTFEGPKADTGVDDQVNILDAVIAENPDVLCLAAIDMASCGAQLESAYDDEIPVIILDSGVNNSELVYSVCATDNYSAGAEAARKLCEKIGDEGEVAVLSHEEMGETSMERVKGFEEEISANHPNVEIVKISYEPAKEGDATLEEQMKAVLVLYPNLKGYFATNEVVSIKALNVLKEYQDRGIQLVGFDLGKTQTEAIRQGTEAGVITQNPYGMGYTTVVAGVRAKMGLENDPFVDTGYQWIDQSNIDLEENAKFLYE
ncbi:MAG: substrate-binding domain-containing protein [Clostridiales bacterium]|nr:substrate-binding domain-containing protein [Clostridiales bacterium]